eukprot:572915-Rhodomonas_salina.1
MHFASVPVHIVRERHLNPHQKSDGNHRRGIVRARGGLVAPYPRSVPDIVSIGQPARRQIAELTLEEGAKGAARSAPIVTRGRSESEPAQAAMQSGGFWALSVRATRRG